MRIVRNILIGLFCCLTVPSVLYVAVSSITGADPIDVLKDEVPDTRALPGYEFVHHPRIAALVDDTKAVEPDSGWDAQWVLDGVIVRSRRVGKDGLEFEWESDAKYTSHTEITDNLANLLAENGFASE